MRNFFEPAGQPWLKQVLTSIRSALSDIWPTPLRLKDYATVDLPAAPTWSGGVVYDETTGLIAYSDGTSWIEVYGAGATAAAARSKLGVGSAPKGLFDYFTNAGNVTTGETDLYSSTLVASQLATNGDKIEAEYGGVFVSSATATREIRIYFAGTAIFDSGALTLSLSSAWTAYVTIIRVSATVIRYMISFATEGAALAAYTAVGELTGLTLSNTAILKITGQSAGVGAATNDIVARLGSVLFAPAA